jgi:hypothetical protein
LSNDLFTNWENKKNVELGRKPLVLQKQAIVTRIESCMMTQKMNHADGAGPQKGSIAMSEVDKMRAAWTEAGTISASTRRRTGLGISSA